MRKAILGRKVGMTQIFKEDGVVVPVTVVKAGPCVVVRKKSVDSDGYVAVQVGFEEAKKSRLTKPVEGQYKKPEIAPKRHLREFYYDAHEEMEVGQEIKADIFETGDMVDVTGMSKGKGFQGTIKRWGQSRGPMSHGSKYHRGLGSMGSTSDPARVFKTKKMPGQMGAVIRTVQNLEIVGVDADKNMLLVKGSIPGANGALVTVSSAAKA